MKRILSIIIALMLVCGLCGCGEKEVIYKTFEIEDQNISIELPDDWQKDMEDTDLDLFCNNDEANLGIFVFEEEDIARSQTSLEAWEAQNKYDLERYEKVKSVAHTPKFESDDKNLKTALYSAETDGIEIYLYYAFAESKAEPGEFVWVMFCAIPELAKENLDLFDKAVDSIKIGDVDTAETQNAEA